MSVALAVALLGLAAYVARRPRRGTMREPRRGAVRFRVRAPRSASPFAEVEGQAVPDPGPLHVTSEATVRITVYDATRTLRAQGEGEVRVLLPPGLYSVHFDRGGAVDREIVDHERATELVHGGPATPSPVPFLGATTSHECYVTRARQASLAAGPADASRLFVFLRRKEPSSAPRSLPSEPITIRDVNGRPLDMVARHNAEIDDVHGYVAFSYGIAPGTYRLRAERSRRELAITVPAGRSAQVFIADTGSVRLDELRVALVRADAAFDPARPIWRAMESMITALRTPGATLPAAPRSLLPAAIDDDLCFGIAAAHLLRRAGDSAALDAVLERLAGYADVPDIAILCKVARSAAPVAIATAPPLFRHSLVLAMTHAALDTAAIPIDSPLARAARTRLHDSVWCTWSTRTWDERWIEPTIERLRSQDQRLGTAEIARRLALPPQTVALTLRTLDATALTADGHALECRQVSIPGYAVEHKLGHGARSTVFRATRLSDMSPVALKVVPVGDAAMCAGVLAALHEQSWVDHPQVLARGARGVLASRAVWWESELCRGSVLDVLTEVDAPLSIAEACRLALQALAGLDFLHARGRAHGRIKPENLLVREDGSLVISDQALPCDATSLETSDQRHAPRFAPYEQVCGERAPHPTSDVWSLAATLYFLLTLEQPRDEYGGQSATDAARDNVIVPLAVRRPDVPPALARCIDRALSVSPAMRPADASAFRAQLLSLADAGRPTSSTASAPERAIPSAAQPRTSGLSALPRLGTEPPRGTIPPPDPQRYCPLPRSALPLGTPTYGFRAPSVKNALAALLDRSGGATVRTVIHEIPRELREPRASIESAVTALLDQRDAQVVARHGAAPRFTQPQRLDCDDGDAPEARGSGPCRALRDTEGPD